MLLLIINIINLLIFVLRMMLVVLFVLSLLINFNIVNRHNDFVMGLWKGLMALLDPLLRPLRRVLPDTGAIDFSPLLLLLILWIIEMILSYAAASAVTTATQ